MIGRESCVLSPVTNLVILSVASPSPKSIAGFPFGSNALIAFSISFFRAPAGESQAVSTVDGHSASSIRLVQGPPR